MNNTINEVEDIAVELHRIAMDLSTLGGIYKAKGKTHLYNDYLQLAYLLDKEAAIRIQNNKEQIARHASYPRSAGWLAYKSGKYLEAKELAELGLKHQEFIDGYEVSKLHTLLQSTEEKIKELSLIKSKDKQFLHLWGVVSSANVDEKHLEIRQNGEKTYQLIKVKEEDILNIARAFLGETVEIEAQKDSNGSFILQEIRRAA